MTDYKYDTMLYICISTLSPQTIGCLSWFLPVLLPVLKYIVDSTPFILVRKRQIGCQLFYFFLTVVFESSLFNASFISMWQRLLKCMLFLVLNYCYFLCLLHWSILSFLCNVYYIFLYLVNRNYIFLIMMNKWQQLYNFK